MTSNGRYLRHQISGTVTVNTLFIDKKDCFVGRKSLLAMTEILEKKLKN